MNLIFDGRVFEMPFSGIAKASLNLYSACNTYYPEQIHFTGVYKKKIVSNLPNFIKTKKLAFSLHPYNNRNINRIIKSENAKIMHFPWNGDIPHGNINCKKIITIHDLLPLEIPNSFNTDEERNRFIDQKKNDVKNADVIFTDSEYSKQKIIEVLAPSVEPIVLYFGVTINSSSNIIDRSSEKPYFLYVGGYHIRKGIKDILKALVYMSEKEKLDFKVKIVGLKSRLDNETENLLKKCTELNVIEETGYVSEEELVTLYYNAIGLLYLSKYEGFGLPPLEAMSVGCPVVTTKYTSIPEICGNAALYVEPSQVEDVAQAITNLLTNSTQRDELKVRGIQQSGLFSWKKAADIFMKELK